MLIARAGFTIVEVIVALVILSTTVEHIQVTSPDTLDYLMVTVNVTGPELSVPVKRTLVVAAP